MLKIEQYKTKYLEDIAKIFVNSYKHQRQIYQELPLKYSNLNNIAKMLDSLLEKNPGVVALNNNKIAGYMSGKTDIDSFKGSLKGVYTPEWAHGTINTPDKEEIYYKLYKHLAREWVSDKNYTHVTTYFSNDDVLKELYYNFSFGMLVIDGLRPLSEIEVDSVKDTVIREAEDSDIEAIKYMHKGINQHLLHSPVFLYHKDSDLSESAIYNKFFGDDFKTFVAVKNDRIVSGIRCMLDKGPGCKVVVDKGTLGINFGFTDIEYRGSGVATYLLNEVLRWGASNGMLRCTVDFESQNREAYRFWLRHFKPICYTVIRKVDDRI